VGGISSCPRSVPTLCTHLYRASVRLSLCSSSHRASAFNCNAEFRKEGCWAQVRFPCILTFLDLFTFPLEYMTLRDSPPYNWHTESKTVCCPFAPPLGQCPSLSAAAEGHCTSANPCTASCLGSTEIASSCSPQLGKQAEIAGAAKTTGAVYRVLATAVGTTSRNCTGDTSWCQSVTWFNS